MKFSIALFLASIAFNASGAEPKLVVEGGIAMSNPQFLPPAIRDREIEAVRNVASWIRLPINWDELQPADDVPVEKWNWNVIDKIIAKARPEDGSKKLNVLVILGAIPGWANEKAGYRRSCFHGLISFRPCELDCIRERE